MLLYVKVRPNQRFDRVERSGQEGNAPQWLLSLKAPATDGEANRHLLKYLGEILDIPRSRILLKRGAAARIKCLEIQAEEAYVLARLQAACQ